jgi:hypothetical protein
VFSSYFCSASFEVIPTRYTRMLEALRNESEQTKDK